MAKIIDMPKLSPTMEEGQISAWHKKEGDAIGVDELLAEVETDKATMEFRSFDKGTLLKILAPAGSVVKLGQPVAIVGAAGEDVSALAAAGGGAAATQAGAAAATTPAPPSAAGPAGPPPGALAPVTTAGALPAAEGGRVRASPYVRKLARERGLTLGGVAGTGPHGRIVARDLEGLAPAVSAASAAAAPAAQDEAPEVRPLSMMRKTIAKRLTESKQTVPHFYLTIDVDAEALHTLRERINDDLATSVADDKDAPKVSFNDLVLKAVAIALTRVPAANAQFTPDAILYHRRVDLSVAVAVDDGLVTPVVRGADKKSVLAIAREVRELAGRARQKKLKPEEMAGGTFSVSNLGMFGIDEFSAVINPPEGAILAVGQVRREPVVRGDAVVPGRKLAMTLSCDHRVIDGAVGATFLKALRGLLEHPGQILVL
ncbi:MAG: 2-oxo acid dehydrogenase subunit E2 [Polyangiaceae bacterium]|jgi:pyruvate dehydrogenase E2 component (dihydrolipoamide acetyltransferase)|nr:2-oxo acid dehydrogenase subunit E2 [Polyangiaceae bacterium]MBK8936128.1 2-oxo acid dehydrogenase subunit E2 [Polyangiaceae bacterium]